MSSGSPAPESTDEPNDQETPRACATCGAPLDEFDRPAVERRDFQCANGHAGTIAENGHTQGPAFEVTGQNRMMTDGGRARPSVHIESGQIEECTGCGRRRLSDALDDHGRCGHCNEPALVIEVVDEDVTYTFGPSTAAELSNHLEFSINRGTGDNEVIADRLQALLYDIEEAVDDRVATDGGTTTHDPVNPSECTSTNSNDAPCGRPVVPGTRYCTYHIGDAADDDDAQVMKDQGLIVADDLQGMVVADTDTGTRYRIDARDDIALVPEDDDHNPQHHTPSDLLHELAAGEYYTPNGDEVRGLLKLLVEMRGGDGE